MKNEGGRGEENKLILFNIMVIWPKCTSQNFQMPPTASANVGKFTKDKEDKDTQIWPFINSSEVSLISKTKFSSSITSVVWFNKLLISGSFLLWISAFFSSVPGIFNFMNWLNNENEGNYNVWLFLTVYVVTPS